MKQVYVVRGAAGVRDVIAKSEEEARHLAMCLRWGPPSGIYVRHTGMYQGLGLDIVSVSPIGAPPVEPEPEKPMEPYVPGVRATGKRRKSSIRL